MPRKNLTLVAAEIRATQAQRTRLSQAVNDKVVSHETALVFSQIVQKLRVIEALLAELEEQLTLQRRKTTESCALELQTGVASTSFATQEEFIEWAGNYLNS